MPPWSPAAVEPVDPVLPAEVPPADEPVPDCPVILEPTAPAVPVAAESVGWTNDELPLGTETDGVLTDGVDTDGVETGGVDPAGVETGGTVTDGTVTDGTDTEGTPTARLGTACKAMKVAAATPIAPSMRGRIVKTVDSLAARRLVMVPCLSATLPPRIEEGCAVPT